MKTLALLTIFAAAATNLLLPLYVWPASRAWDNVYKAIDAKSQLTFQIIINPHSGPGISTPDEGGEYATGVSKLNSYSNVQLFDYVHCNYGTSSGDEINRNVTRWNAWNADPSTSIDDAKSIFSGHPFKSIFNPGSTPQNIKLYESADYIVVFESEASSYNDAVFANQIPPGNASQSSILIYNFAEQGDDGQLEVWLRSMVSAGVGSANVLNAGYDEANSDDQPAGLGIVASILSSGRGDSTGEPANGTDFVTSKPPHGDSTATRSAGDTATMTAPEITSSGAPS